MNENNIRTYRTKYVGETAITIENSMDIAVCFLKFMIGYYPKSVGIADFIVKYEFLYKSLDKIGSANSTVIQNIHSHISN